MRAPPEKLANWKVSWLPAAAALGAWLVLVVAWVGLNGAS